MALTMKQQMDTLREQNKKLVEMISEERERVVGYEQIAKLHAAYIAVLLKRLGATKENPAEIADADVHEAMQHEVRGYPDGKAWKLYIEPKE